MNARVHHFPFAVGTTASLPFGLKSGMQLAVEVPSGGFTLQRRDAAGAWTEYDVTPAVWPVAAGLLNVTNPPPGTYRIAGVGAGVPVTAYVDNHGC